jgi:tetratricopeptide (TPR) repeat protein
VLALNPSDAWAHARVAAALLALGRFDEVAAHVERARRLSPLESRQVSFGRAVAGAAHFHKGEDDAAYQQFHAAALANPNNATAWALMASLGVTSDVERSPILRSDFVPISPALHDKAAPVGNDGPSPNASRRS